MMQEFVQQVIDTCRSVVSGIHTAFPGTITAFDAWTGLATVLPSVTYRKEDGSTVSYPQVTGVPVVFPQAMGQSATIAYPVRAGDGCLVVIAEQSIESWLYGQETSTNLQFDLTNAICIPGLFAKPNPVMQEACGSNAVVVDVKGTRLTVRRDGVSITGDLDVSGTISGGGVSMADGNLSMSGKITSGSISTGSVSATSVSASSVEAGGISLSGHTHTGYAGVTTSTPR